MAEQLSGDFADPVEQAEESTDFSATGDPCSQCQTGTVLLQQATNELQRVCSACTVRNQVRQDPQFAEAACGCTSGSNDGQQPSLQPPPQPSPQPSPQPFSPNPSPVLYDQFVQNPLDFYGGGPRGGSQNPLEFPPPSSQPPSGQPPLYFYSGPPGRSQPVIHPAGPTPRTFLNRQRVHLLPRIPGPLVNIPSGPGGGIGLGGPGGGGL